MVEQEELAEAKERRAAAWDDPGDAEEAAAERARRLRQDERRRGAVARLPGGLEWRVWDALLADPAAASGADLEKAAAALGLEVCLSARGRFWSGCRHPLFLCALVTICVLSITKRPPSALSPSLCSLP